MKCSLAGCGGWGNWFGVAAAVGYGFVETGRILHDLESWSWLDEDNAVIVVVLHEPQDLVNIAHVVRGMKNFGVRDLRLVNPREYEAYRVEGIAHQTQDVLARVRTYATLEEALADCVHIVGFTARGRTAKRNLQRPRDAATDLGHFPAFLLRPIRVKA